MNWVDIAIFVVLAINSIVGFNEGFIISVFNLVGLILSYFLARLYYPLVAGFILNSQGIYDKIRGFVDKRVYSIFENNTNSFGLKSLLEGLKLPKPLIDTLSKSPKIDTYATEFNDAALNVMSEALTRIFIDIISFIIAFIIARILILIIVRFINMFAELPLLKQFNKLLGLSFGFIKGLLILLLIFAIITPFISISPSGFLAEGVYGSTIGYYLYDNNIVLKYLKDIIL